MSTMNDMQQRVQEAIDRLVESGAERGLQVAVYRHGDQVVDAVAGVADPATGRPVTPDTPFYQSTRSARARPRPWSMCSPSAAPFGYDTPIVELWPEFGAHGKENGDRAARAEPDGRRAGPAGPTLTPEDLCDWDKMCALIADAEPWWEPGTEDRLSRLTFGYIVGEIVRRATGKPISQVLREEVAGPLGVADELFFGVPAVRVGPAGRGWRTPKAARRWLAAMPADSPFFKLAPRAMTTTAAYGNRADVLQANIPAGGTVSARAVARMYAALLGEVDGVRLISPNDCARSPPWRCHGPDQVFGFPTAWGLGYADHAPAPTRRALTGSGWAASGAATRTPTPPPGRPSR